MDTIIGLGNAGCNIVDKFAQFPQYLTYKLDVGLKRTPTTFPLKVHQKIEDYEEKLPSLKTFFKEVEGEILFVVGGSGKISSATLSILEYLKKHKINILYIKPELSLLNNSQVQLERVVYNVLQEYTRSGVFERMYIISNEEIAQFVGDISIKNYNDKINEVLVSTIHMINIYNNIESIVDNFIQPEEIARISTIGISNLENEKKLFFFLDNVKEMKYYYAINKKRLAADGSLMKKITENIKMENDLKISYGIFSTDYPDDYVYCIANSSFIQFRENEIKTLQLGNDVVQ